jgi:hypothetical protein
VGLKASAFSPGCLRTGINRPPRGPGHVLRLEDLWSRFVTRTGTKGPFKIKFVFFVSEFLYFLYFFYFLFFLLSNHLYSHIKLDTYDSHSISHIKLQVLVVLTSRSVTHHHTAPPLARLTFSFLPY